ncbi:MAG: GntR family transcriptional regulator [Burkholderiales bacterium]
MPKGSSTREKKPVNEAGSARPLSNQEIYERIYEAVSERRLPPGTKLSEEKLGRAFGVSRTRIREVLCRLSSEKIVGLIPNRGAFVASPTVEETHAVFEARKAIEIALVKILAERASPKDVSRLRQHAAEEHAARLTGDWKRLIRLSGDFHVLIAELAGNPFLLETMRALVSLTRLIVFLYDSPRTPACLDHEHELIVDAIQRGDAPKAEREMVEHINHVVGSLQLKEEKVDEIDIEKIFA